MNNNIEFANDQRLKRWTNEVKEYLESLKSAIDAVPEAKDLYKGFSVWDSKFIYKPKVMFIGINPGTGDPNQTNEVKTGEYTMFTYNEYFGGNKKYTLARETINVFREIGAFSNDGLIKDFFEDQCIKTNFFYMATTEQNDIKKSINMLQGNGFSYHDYWRKSAYFTIELIKICEPEIVICEGKSVFDFIVRECYDPENNEISWSDDVGQYKDKQNNTQFVGYSRTLSSIKNKNGLAQLLKPLLH
jgi:hypothetical protein